MVSHLSGCLMVSPLEIFRISFSCLLMLFQRQLRTFEHCAQPLVLTFEAGRKERALLPASLRKERALLPASLSDVPGLLGVLAPGSHSREQKAAQRGGGALLRSRRALLRSRRGSSAGALLQSRRGSTARAASRRAQQGGGPAQLGGVRSRERGGRQPAGRRNRQGQTPQQTGGDRRQGGPIQIWVGWGGEDRGATRGKRRVLRKVRSEPCFKTQCWGGFFRGRVPKKQDNK
ncbi:hypothetical protein PVAP13_4KG317000 [Panicum virgatum]|uniref:Uncharacterized protein n=1 Tax=Panicum virgatum TaxID=38727 RepID=A0A8T0TSB2_PANVG|nr:hypothetical protein PVAP13_4KG317000 [Panicum virgatum]KAG2612661.1 hypothetical protein PVAP13_4KG317000 [Panicum virgatum]